MSDALMFVVCVVFAIIVIASSLTQRKGKL